MQTIWQLNGYITDDFTIYSKVYQGGHFFGRLAADSAGSSATRLRGGGGAAGRPTDAAEVGTEAADAGTNAGCAASTSKCAVVAARAAAT